MERLSLLVDEHVPRVFTGALRSTGFDVTTAQERYGQESVDSSILDDCAETVTVVLTNDRDFVRTADERDHAGVVMYTDRRFRLDDPTNAASIGMGLRFTRLLVFENPRLGTPLSRRVELLESIRRRTWVYKDEGRAREGGVQRSAVHRRTPRDHWPERAPRENRGCVSVDCHRTATAAVPGRGGGRNRSR